MTPEELTAEVERTGSNAFVRFFGKGQIVSLTTHAVAGTEASVTHSLGAPPTYYLVLGQAAAGSLYDGATANTASTFYFKSDATATAFRVLLVVGGTT